LITATSRSHLDHGLSRPQLTHVLTVLNDGVSNVVVGPFGQFFIATVKIPEELGQVLCGLHGPLTGGNPVDDREAYFGTRGMRPYPSRLCRRPKITSPYVTAIVIGHEDSPSNQRIDTVFGGPLSPMEVGDPDLSAENRPEALEFWSKHALTPNSMEVRAEGILVARPNIGVPFIIMDPSAKRILAQHITLAKLTPDTRKQLKERGTIPDAPEVHFEEKVCLVERPALSRKSWVKFVDDEGQKLLREYVLGLKIGLEDYDLTRPYHVSLANLTGSQFDSVGDITPDRK
jgi:hypothetical protein